VKQNIGSETGLLEFAVYEYRNLGAENLEKNGVLDADQIVSILIQNHDWTNQGANTIVSLVNQYGAFMLRNALALAIVLGREDGSLGF
jgi:hypothetical protein